jgi:hypothetical protein
MMCIHMVNWLASKSNDNLINKGSITFVFTMVALDELDSLMVNLNILKLKKNYCCY